MKMLPLGKWRFALLISVIAMCFVLAFFMSSNRLGYRTASDEGFFHFPDNSTNAILKRNKVVGLSENVSLQSIFELALTAPRDRPYYIDWDDGNGPVPDVIAWKTIKRNIDGVSIRFGEGADCDRALVFDDDQINCDEKLYLELYEMINKAIAQKMQDGN